MKLQRQRKRAGWSRTVILYLSLLLYMFIFAPTVQAVTNSECMEGRHQYAEIGRNAATATEDGMVTYRCTLCGQQYTEILYATNHIWEPWITDTPPTCTEPGEKHRTCTSGQSHDEYAEIPALGHDYVESITTEPGCEEEGVKTFICSRCGDSYTDSIHATGHDYKESITKEPSCLEDGVKTFICRHNPAHTYTEAIPAFESHSFGEWYVEIPEGEGTPGIEARICSHDGFKETREIPALAISSQPYNIIDIILVTMNIVLLGIYSVVIGRYVRCLRYINKRQKTVQRVNELIEMVEKIYDFK